MKSSLLNLLMFASKKTFHIFLVQVVAMQLLFASASNSQKLEEVKLSLEIKEASLEEVFDQLKLETGFRFGYNRKVLQSDVRFTFTGEEVNLENVLLDIAEKAALKFKRINDQILVIRDVQDGGSKIEVIADKPIEGKVTDAETGEPLVGATVMVKGTQIGTITDVDGHFKLSIPEDAETLVFTYIGYETYNIAAGSMSYFDVPLTSNVASLEEIVVIGYGSLEKGDITGSVASLKSEDFNKGVITSPEQLLQGKMAGVNVTSASGEPGATQSLTIRGPGGIRTGNAPLYVVDGLPLDNSAIGGGLNPLNFINPSDIESMDVLKDASATAIYGTRGANGVVLITTKKGKSGQSQLNFSSSLAVSNMARKIDVFNAQEFRNNVTAIGGTLDDQGASTDWQDEITRTALTQNYNVSLSGGTENLTYFASVSMQDQEGIIKDNDLKKYNGRINITQKLLDGRVKVDYNLSASKVKGHRPNINGMLGSALAANPTYAARDENGDVAYYGNMTNPLQYIGLYDDYTNTTRILGNISPSLEIVKGLTYKLNIGIDNSHTTEDQQWIPSAEPSQNGRLNSSFNDNENYLIENYLTYDKRWGRHLINALAGQSYQKFFVQTRWWSISDFEDNGIDPRYNPALGQTISLNGDNNGSNWPSGSAQNNYLQSFFARANYDFADKYLLTATIRADGSSKFGENNRYGYFPSVALGWRLSEEGFLQSGPFSDLKLRAGWGQTGNQEVPNKITKASSTASVSGTSSYPFSSGDNYPAGVLYKRLANPDIQWEVSTQTNIGLDFEILKGALSGSVDYFNKVSSNILLERTPSDPIQPADSYWANIDGLKIVNQGVEVVLDYQHVSQNGFKYGIGGNITFIENEVKNSPFTLLTTGTAQGSGLSSATINGYVNGEPIGTFYMKKFTGIGEDGTSQYYDVEGNDDDRIAAGSALPKKMFNFHGNIGYKGFDLSVNFNGVSGNKIYNNTANTLFYKARLAKSLNTTDAAIKYANEDNNNPASVSTRYLENGAFLRLNNMTLGYTFNTTELGIAEWVKSIRLSVTGQNLFVITKYTGYDPEVNTDRSSTSYQSYGIDYQSYPKARSIVFGVNVSF